MAVCTCLVQLASESREMLMQALKATQIELAAVRNQLQVLLLLTLALFTLGCSHWCFLHWYFAHWCSHIAVSDHYG